MVFFVRLMDVGSFTSQRQKSINVRPIIKLIELRLVVYELPPSRMGAFLFNLRMVVIPFAIYHNPYCLNANSRPETGLNQGQLCPVYKWHPPNQYNGF
jgi:hypothetical protein